MATWSSRGLRGSRLEEIINITNEKYRDLKLALVQKIPTPITPMEIDDNRHITLAYFEQRSTVDYIGVVQSYPICFDAKECASDTFPLANIHEHQFNFMRDFEGQGGISFLLIYYSRKNIFYYMRFNELAGFLARAGSGGQKSVRFEELTPEYFIGSRPGVQVHYLEQIDRDINEDDREDNKQQ
jgi:recombination protein U